MLMYPNSISAAKDGPFVSNSPLCFRRGPSLTNVTSMALCTECSPMLMELFVFLVHILKIGRTHTPRTRRWLLHLSVVPWLTCGTEPQQGLFLQISCSTSGFQRVFVANTSPSSVASILIQVSMRRCTFSGYLRAGQHLLIDKSHPVVVSSKCRNVHGQMRWAQHCLQYILNTWPSQSRTELNSLEN